MLGTVGNLQNIVCVCFHVLLSANGRAPLPRDNCTQLKEICCSDERKEPCCCCLLILFLAASPFQYRLNSSNTAGGLPACLSDARPCPKFWFLLVHHTTWGWQLCWRTTWLSGSDWIKVLSVSASCDVNILLSSLPIWGQCKHIYTHTQSWQSSDCNRQWNWYQQLLNSSTLYTSDMLKMLSHDPAH